MSFLGETETETDEEELTLIKIDGKWKVYDEFDAYYSELTGLAGLY